MTKEEKSTIIPGKKKEDEAATDVITPNDN